MFNDRSIDLTTTKSMRNRAHFDFKLKELFETWKQMQYSGVMGYSKKYFCGRKVY